FFFFSSRRRHTRWPRDWSSDVCSSDLSSRRITSGDATGTAHLAQSISTALLTHSYRTNLADWEGEKQSAISLTDRVPGAGGETRSEERRVGKECRSRGARYDEKKRKIE